MTLLKSYEALKQTHTRNRRPTPRQGFEKLKRLNVITWVNVRSYKSWAPIHAGHLDTPSI